MSGITPENIRQFYSEANRRFVRFYLNYSRQNILDLEAQKEELENLLTALSISEQQAWWEIYLQLVETVRFLLLDLGYWLEYRHFLEQIVSHQNLFLDSEHQESYLHLLDDYASLLLSQGEPEKSSLLYQQIIDYASEKRQSQLLLFAYLGLGTIYFSSRQLDQAQKYWQLAATEGDVRGQTWVRLLTDYLLAFAKDETGSLLEVEIEAEYPLQNKDHWKRYFEVTFQAWRHFNRQELSQAQQLFLEMAALAQQLEDQDGQALAFFQLGEIARMTDQFDQSLAHYRMSEQLALRMNNHLGLASVYAGIGRLHLLRNRYDLARPYLEMCVRLEQEMKNDRALAQNLYLLGYAAANTGDPGYAEKCFLQARTLFSRIDPDQASKIDETIERLRAVVRSTA